jgi:hypothetical protein
VWLITLLFFLPTTLVSTELHVFVQHETNRSNAAGSSWVQHLGLSDSAEYIALSTALRDLIPMMDLLKEMILHLVIGCISHRQ